MGRMWGNKKCPSQTLGTEWVPEEKAVLASVGDRRKRGVVRTKKRTEYRHLKDWMSLKTDFNRAVSAV